MQRTSNPSSISCTCSSFFFSDLSLRYPELIRVEEEVPIPEIRAYGAKAKATLVKAIKDGGGKLPDEE